MGWFHFQNSDRSTNETKKIYNIRICYSQFAKTTYAPTKSGVLGNSGIHFDLSEGQLSKLETCWGQRKKCWGHGKFLILMMIIKENFCIPNIWKAFH